MVIPVLAAILLLQSPPDTFGAGTSAYAPDSRNNLELCYNPDDDEFFIVYRATTPEGSIGYFGQRIDAATGEALGAAISITGVTGRPVGDPAIAYAPATAEQEGRYLVTWSHNASGNGRADNDKLVGQVMGPEGVKVGSTLEIDDAGYVAVSINDLNNQRVDQDESDIVFDGTDFLVVWRRYDQANAPNVADVKGRRITTSGTAAEPGFDIRSTPADEGRPAVAWLPWKGQALVAWSESIPDGGGEGDDPQNNSRRIRVATVGSGLTHLLDDSPGFHDWPRMSVDLVNRECLVVWESTDQPFCWAGKTRSAGSVVSMGNILGRRIDENGAPLGAQATYLQPPTPLLGGIVNFCPAAVWQPATRRFIVHWQQGPFDAPNQANVLSAILMPGTLEILETSTIASDDVDELTPFLAARTGTDEIASAWIRYDSQGTPRQVVRGVIYAPGAPDPSPSPTPTPTPAGGGADDGSKSSGGGLCSTPAGAQGGALLLGTALLACVLAVQIRVSRRMP